MELKTTLEIPDELFRKAKMRAATENRRLRDLIAEGLTLVLNSSPPLPTQESRPSNDPEALLKAFESIRLCPSPSPTRIQTLIDESHHLRRGGWNREDLRS